MGERHNRSACVWSLLFEVETMAVRGCPLGFPWFPELPDPSLKASGHPNPLLSVGVPIKGPACSPPSRPWVLPGFPFSFKLLHCPGSSLDFADHGWGLIGRAFAYAVVWTTGCHVAFSGRGSFADAVGLDLGFWSPRCMLLPSSFHPSLSLASAGR